MPITLEHFMKCGSFLEVFFFLSAQRWKKRLIAKPSKIYVERSRAVGVSENAH